jgi:D-aminopeptidase
MNPHHLHTPAGKPRARSLGIAVAGTPGPFNAITDVAGVEVGYTTLISGSGPLVRGQGPVRTGVTAILPRGPKLASVPCAAGSYSFNGSGEMTGLLWIEESGELSTPITITNTHSCGVTRDATIEWMLATGNGTAGDYGLPVAAETYDGELNDMNGFHVTREHTIAALESARGGPIEQGSVGGGTGMICYDFKAGSGTASRAVSVQGVDYTLGCFVQANFGRRPELVVLGQHVGPKMPGGELRGKPAGSIIVVIATDAPLLPHQLKRIARRVPVGLARTGAIGHNGSGDIFLAFSTANLEAYQGRSSAMEFMPNAQMDGLFAATAEAVEEAILDSMIVNETMTGANNNMCVGLPRETLTQLLGL